MYLHMLVFIYVFLYLVHWGDLEVRYTPSVISWHQSSVIQRKESGFLEEMVKSRADSGKEQDRPGIPCGATK